MPYFRYVGDHAEFAYKGEGDNATSIALAPGDYVELSKDETEANSHLSLIEASESDLPKENKEGGKK